MKESKVAVIYETDYAKAYNSVVDKYFNGYDKYNPTDLNKTRPLAIYHFGKVKSVAFKLTTTQQPRYKGILFAHKNEFGTNKKSYLTYIPVLVNNNELWKHNYYVFDDVLRKKLYNSLKNNSTQKKPYRRILEDAIIIADQF